jgi:hypothetical protein
MSPPQRNLRRRLLEGAFWVALIALFWGLDALTKLEERNRLGVGLDDFRLFTEQVTSAGAALVMVLFVAWWLVRYPVDMKRLARSITSLVTGSVLFAIGHYTLMVALRIVIFFANGMHYVYQHDHFNNLVFEYQKDVKIYLGMVGIIAVYRRVGRLRAERAAAPPPGGIPGKLLVQTGSGERLIDITRVDYLQAARNYVSVHCDGKEYIVRETLANLEAKLAPAKFLRTHRSFLVNAERIAGVQPTDAGAHEIQLASGVSIPLSRSYRDAIRSELKRVE